MDNTDYARIFAQIAHDDTGIKRKGSGKPYHVHPQGVADIIRAYGGTNIQIQIAECHDLIEDTGLTEAELEDDRHLGAHVSQAVAELSNDNGKIRKLQKEYIKQGYDESKAKVMAKEKYLNKKLLILSNDALVVKLGDNYFNATDSPTPDQKQRIINNVKFLMKHRRLTKMQKELAEAILSLDR